jgi:hypothetical protein
LYLLLFISLWVITYIKLGGIVVMLKSCIWEVLRANVSRNTSYSEIFLCFSSVPLRQFCDSISVRPQFFHLSYHSTLYSWNTDSVVKQITEVMWYILYEYAYLHKWIGQSVA